MHFSAQLLVKYENMNRQEEYQSDGDAAMKDQNDGDLVEDHSEQAGSEGNYISASSNHRFAPSFFR